MERLESVNLKLQSSCNPVQLP
ncbi:TPA: hypothetical protein N0F65_004029 [Lagenidium giganteum]|uniref:Uncharacterized protein n=1 Tax=Lagenidium giganteum TaxID=4803 RepID=A0AAV2YUX8_9STRA|nr:TPA: hypothetical protein N0F65_004029 [Lagenidium giganteum]